MKIQILSDLHCEFIRGSHRTFAADKLIPTSPEADVVVFAGDIDKGIRFIEEAPKHRKGNQHFIYVLGNHEGYNASNWERIIERCQNLSEPLSDWFHFLHRSAVDIDGHRFIGATLWTDGRFEGAELTQSKTLGERYMNDYQLIKTHSRVITFEDTLRWHLDDLAFISRELEVASESSSYVVVTHHLPHGNSVDSKYKNSPLNPLFVSNLNESLFKKAKLWIHGHTHSSSDYYVGKCRVVANPRGYPDGMNDFENKSFLDNKIIEI